MSVGAIDDIVGFTDEGCPLVTATYRCTYWRKSPVSVSQVPESMEALLFVRST